MDSIIKLWDLNMGCSQGPAHTLYEHEEGILAAAVHLTQDMMVTIDTDFQVMVREIENPDTLLCQFSPQMDSSNLQGPCESAICHFNRENPAQLCLCVN